MKVKSLFGAVAAAGFAVALSVTANAATISIGLSQDGGAISTVATSPTGFASFAGSFGDYVVNAINGTGNPLLPPSGVLNSNALDVSAATTVGTHTLDVFVTTSGNLIPLGALPFTSAFTLNSTLGIVATTMSTFLDTGNGIFTTSGATVTQLGLAGPFTAGPTTEVDVTSANTGAGPYSVTALYHVVTTGGASSNATINVSVPGPVVGAGLPGLLAACFGLVALARRRRNAAIA